jgi:hypothetical protein
MPLIYSRLHGKRELIARGDLHLAWMHTEIMVQLRFNCLLLSTTATTANMMMAAVPTAA